MRPQFIVCGNMNIARNSDMRDQVFFKIDSLLKRLKPLCSLLGRPNLRINGTVLVAMCKKVEAVYSKGYGWQQFHIIFEAVYFRLGHVRLTAGHGFNADMRFGM